MDSRPNLLVTWPTGLPQARVMATRHDDDPGLYDCEVTAYDGDADAWASETTHVIVRTPFDCLVLGPCRDCGEVEGCPVLRRIAFVGMGLRDERYLRVRPT